MIFHLFQVLAKVDESQKLVAMHIYFVNYLCIYIYCVSHNYLNIQQAMDKEFFKKEAQQNFDKYLPFFPWASELSELQKTISSQQNNGDINKEL